MESKRQSFAFVLLTAIALSVHAAPNIPESAWQSGTLLSVTNETHSRLAGVYNNGQGVMGEQIRIVWHCTIDGGQYVYEADRTTRRHDKPLDVTINGPVRYAVIGLDLYLQDETGKIFKLGIATKTLKTDGSNHAR